MLEFIEKGLEPHIGHLMRQVTQEDIVRLTEIRIKRISKFDTAKATDKILELEGKIDEVQNHLANLIDFAIDYFTDLKARFGANRERRTEAAQFDSVEATKVVIRNQKLYMNREEGFVGTALKKDEYVGDCSDIDDIIVFRSDGTYSVSKVKDKAFFGKNIIHAAVWKKGDARTVYNCIYKDGESKIYYIKRFNVTSITRDREYNVSKSEKGNEVLYLTSNPNGEAEVVTVLLRQVSKLKRLKFDIDFADQLVKGRGVKGNQVTKFAVKRIELKARGESTLEARKIWFDTAVSRLNTEDRGRLIGSFKGEDRILIARPNGNLKVVVPELSLHFESDMMYLEKLHPDRPLSAVYFDGEKERYFVKRFFWEEGDKEENIVTEHPKSRLVFLSNDSFPRIEMVFRKTRGGAAKDPEAVKLDEFIAVKGIKAKGNQLTPDALTKVVALDSAPEEEEEEYTEDHTGADESFGPEWDGSSEPLAPGDAALDEPGQASGAPSKGAPKGSEGEDEPPQITLEF